MNWQARGGIGMTPDLRKIDALVAEKVLGCGNRNEDGGWLLPSGCRYYDWEPTQDIAQAWEAVDHFKGDVEVKRQNGWYFVTLYVPSMQYQGSLPEALCTALLKAHGVSV